MADDTKNEETEGLEETSQEESEETASEESEVEETASEESEASEDAAEDEESDEEEEADEAEASDEDEDDEVEASDEDASDEDDSEDEGEAEAAFEGDEDDYADEDEESDEDDEERDEFDDAFDHLDEMESESEDEDDEIDEESYYDDLDDEDEDEDDLEDDESEYAIDGLAAYFDGPNETLVAAAAARDVEWGWESWDVFTPFPIHGIEDAMGIGRSWLPWVTFGAGGLGFLTANALQFGTLTFDWPMIIGGKPHAPWPSFVPIMFELTVLIGGVTTALVMLIAAGCFRPPKIIDPEITNDRFVLWIGSDDPNFEKARAFMEELDPVEIREITFGS